MSVTLIAIILAGLAIFAVIGAMVVLGLQNSRIRNPSDYEPTLPSGPRVQARAAPALDGDVEADARALMAQGNKIAAIKRVRELTGLGLKEAKDYVEALEAGLAPLAPPVSATLPEPPRADPSTLDAEIGQFLARGNKIAAIKHVRQHTGLGLKEAKDYVEALAKRT